MLCIHSNNTNIYFNLAAEEYLLKNLKEDIFILWRNDPAVVVGKHQNTCREVNVLYALKNDIKIARRLSGGGTVYHDEGNLNFTFIQNGEAGKLINFRKFTDPVRKALGALGVEARFEGNNSLTVNGLKISGNAEHVFKLRVLHHGTLLFSTKMGHLREVLKVDQDAYEDKAVKSVRSKVANIRSFLGREMTIGEFEDYLWHFLSTELAGCKFHEFSDEEKNKINYLMESKYQTQEWIFNWSPKYIFRKRFGIGNEDLNVWLRVEKGIIKESHVSGGAFNEKNLVKLNSALSEKPHVPDTIFDQLNLLLDETNKTDFSAEMLLGAFF